jgi:hypothetical protein
MNEDAAKSLWRAVIRRALVDAAYTGSHPELARDKVAARNWLLNGGPDFEIACMYAGFDPDILRERFRERKIKGQHLMEVQKSRRGRKPRQLTFLELLE